MRHLPLVDLEAAVCKAAADARTHAAGAAPAAVENVARRESEGQGRARARRGDLRRRRRVRASMMCCEALKEVEQGRLAAGAARALGGQGTAAVLIGCASSASGRVHLLLLASSGARSRTRRRRPRTRGSDLEEARKASLTTRPALPGRRVLPWHQFSSLDEAHGPPRPTGLLCAGRGACASRSRRTARTSLDPQHAWAQPLDLSAFPDGRILALGRGLHGAGAARGISPDYDGLYADRRA